MDEKQRRYGGALSARRGFFLAAVAAMPQASGVALGFDRLVKLASGAGKNRSGGVDAAGGEA